LATAEAKTTTYDKDKEMMDDASTATRQATNATANKMVQKPPAVNKKQLALKTIFNPWKTIVATKGATKKWRSPNCNNNGDPNQIEMSYQMVEPSNRESGQDHLQTKDYGDHQTIAESRPNDHTLLLLYNG